MRSSLTDTGASTTAVSVADFKLHARIYHTQDDTPLANTVLAATQVIEHETHRALITRSFVLSLAGFPECGEVILPKSPMVSVTSITYADAAGATQTLSSSVYHTYSVNGVGRVVLKTTASWPSTLGTGGMDVTITFTAGYGSTAGSIPASLVHAVLLQGSHMYEIRTSVNIGSVANEIPMTVQRLIAQYHTGDYA